MWIYEESSCACLTKCQYLATYRYSCEHAKLMQRRTECRESILRKTIERLTKKRQRTLTASRQQVLLNRLAVELVEFITPKTAGQGEMGGRVSGSLAWRLERGETRLAAVSSTVIKPTADEVSNRIIQLQYCCASDQYYR